MANEYMTVGQLAHKMNVSVRTLQYYDKEGLLKASAKSEGGRRLYTSKDVVRLHQILSLKYLGFSLEEIKTKLMPLDKPEDVARMLERQKELLSAQIHSLKEVLDDIDTLRREVIHMDEVDFDKYAYIVSLLQLHNPHYWVIKLFDNELLTHMRDRFGDDPSCGTAMFETYSSILDEALALMAKGEKPGGEKAQAMAKRWWDMIMTFTGGDMSLLPRLVAFNSNKQGWDPKIAAKQQKADNFIGQALDDYLKQQGLNIPFAEDES